MYVFLLFVGVVFNVAAQLFLKTSSANLAALTESATMLLKAKALFFNYFFWLALACYGIGFLVYAIVLSKLELSKAYPASSVSIIVLIFMIAILFQNESFTMSKILGLLLSLIGIVLILK